MTIIRSAFGALLVVALSTASAQVHAAPGEKRVSAVACRGDTCQLVVKVDGDCGITVEPEWLFVTGQNVRLVFDILPAGYYFHPTEGIRFKDEYNPEWRREFFEIGKGEGGGDIFMDAQRRGGPARQSSWADLNTRPGVFRYSVAVVNARTGQECRADPGVVNDRDSQ